mgnify:CR=1 FL=1
MGKIYTKTGDKGGTSLLNGERVKKNSLRVNCYGTIDELNTIIGVAINYIPEGDLKIDLLDLSKLLFKYGSDLATPFNPSPKFVMERINENDVAHLEELIDKYTALMPKLKSFILPGGSAGASFLHQARAVSRRAERLIVELALNEEISEISLKFINRLSDYLFTAARYCNFKRNIKDVVI